MLDLESDRNDLSPSEAADDDLAADELLTIEQAIPDADVAHRPSPPAPTLPVVYYIQAIRHSQGAILRTNLPHTDTQRRMATGMTWLLGRSRNCALVFPEPAVSRCHAVIGYEPECGFYVMDVGSSNGTLCNDRRLVTMQRQILRDGDVLTISHIAVKVFLMTESV
jgi:hypothetical protein